MKEFGGFRISPLATASCLALSAVLMAADNNPAPDRPAAADVAMPDVADTVRGLVEACKGVWTKPVGDVAPDRGCDMAQKAHGPLLGNGRIGIQLSGTPECQRFHISKNDFWTHNSAMVLDCPRALATGGVTLDIPALAGASYRQEQQIYPACVVGEFAKDERKLTTRTWMCRTANLLATELRNEGKAGLEVEASQWAGDPRPAVPAAGGLVTLAHWTSWSKHTYDRFCGLMRDVRLFASCLTAAEVAAVRDGATNAPAAAQAWPLATETEQSGTASLTNVPAMTAVPFTVAVWLNPETDDSVRAARKRQQPSQHTTRAEADVQSVVAQSGNIHGDYYLSLVDRRPHLKMFHWQALADEALPKGQWSHVAATFDGQAIRIYINGRETPVKVVDKVERGDGAGELWFTRHADIHHPQGRGRVVSAVTRVLGAKAQATNGRMTLTLAPGQTATVVTAILSDRDAVNPLEGCRTLLTELDDARLAKWRAEHEAWWKAFWELSFVEVSDAAVQDKYYGCLYIAACACSENPNEVPLGIVGNWVMTDETAWANGHWLNYNYEAPFWGLYSANRIGITASYDGPILDYMDKGRQHVRDMSVPGKLQDTLVNEAAAASGLKAERGVYYPVGIGPWGLAVAPVFWGQKSNAAHAAANMAMRYYSTYDLDYARRVYPFILEVANFWEDYLRFEGGKYVIHHDCISECFGDFKNNKNNVLSLTLVPKVFQAAIDMGVELGVDRERHAKWRDIVQNMSPYTTTLVNNKRVFQTEEEGKTASSYLVRHIFWPLSGIGLDSSEEQREIARNTVDTWGGGPPCIGYPALARIGYDPGTIFQMLLKASFQANYLMCDFGCAQLVENNSTVPATLNEMLMQSHEGVIRFFPCWEKDKPARFYRLRAYGAFLVSGEYADGAVRSARVMSEKGRPCRVQNPWPGQTLRVTDAATGGEVAATPDPNHADCFVFQTQAGRAYELKAVTSQP